MASEKRKAATDGRPNKKAKSSPEEKSTQRKPTKAPSTNTDRRPVLNSVLLQEEKSFPRGGANVLTPLETKQIRAQAERDVLFEQENKKAAPAEDDELLTEDRKAARPAKKRKRESKSEKTEDAEPTGPRVMSLSYKTLVPGSLVLGRVVAITSKDLALALPNNLTGYVPITAVSAKLNERIQALLADDQDDEEEAEDVSLEELFHVGQWLRAIVSQPGEEAPANKHRIELSIDPAVVNAQLNATSITDNCILQATVRSVEDHGVIADIGLNDQSSRGFIAKKELGESCKVDTLQEGQVLLCIVTGKASDGKVIKLSPDLSKFWTPASAKKNAALSELLDVEALLPGTLVDLLVADASPRSVTGKVGGLVDVTVDAVHTGVGSSQDFDASQVYKIGSRTPARILSSLLNTDGTRHVTASLLPHVLALPPSPSSLPPSAPAKTQTAAAALEGSIALSSIVDNAKVIAVSSKRGVYLDLLDEGNKTIGRAFAHISQLQDSHIDDVFATSGNFKLDTVHRARVLSFNPVDGLYYVSLQESVLSQAFLRLEDVKPGQLVDATVEKFVYGGSSGVIGLMIKLTAKITILVPAIHMSDTSLKDPEKKFRPGVQVKARILKVDLDKRQAAATLKKSLLKDVGPMWTSYNDVAVGAEAKGTIFKLFDKSALVQYYGGLMGIVPISEMDESFVSDPSAHFKLGQTVNTRVLSVDPELDRMQVSCKTLVTLDKATEHAWNAIDVGSIVSGRISSVSVDKVDVEIEGGLAGTIAVGHLADAPSKAQSMIKQLKVGQTLNSLVVMLKHDRNHQLTLSHKSKLARDAQNGTLITSFDDLTTGRKVHGFVQNITPEGVYVHFANGLSGLLPKTQLSPENKQQVSFGMHKDQTITVWVRYVDEVRERVGLSMQEPEDQPTDAKSANLQAEIKDAVDSKIKLAGDLAIGTLVKGRVKTTRATQVQLQIAEGVQGRVDVSEVYDDYTDINDPRKPLEGRFTNGDIIEVQILGLRDSKGGHFLAFSHRDTHQVLDLSFKPSRVKNGSKALLQGLQAIKEGEEYTVFINNYMGDFAWVNLSPTIRGRIAIAELSDDMSQLTNPKVSFPIGSALRAKVLKVDAGAGHLDLSARGDGPLGVTFDSLKVGQTIHGRVTKSGESFVTVHLGKDFAASVQLVELSDDFDTASPSNFRKNTIIPLRVLGIDKPNKRVSLSLRPSLVLSSSLPVKDVYFASSDNVKVDMIVRGFVKHIGEKGVYISLSAGVDAFVRISDLSDKYIKEWKSHLELHQLVRGRVVEIDPKTKHVRFSLKQSALDENYKPPVKLDQLVTGSIVTGKVRKVEDFGVFIDIDNTQPQLSGLAHKSQLAETRVVDVRKLYEPGDVVKAKILNVDVEKRKISLGLKMKYFEDEDEDGSEDGGIDVEDAEMEDDEAVDLDDVRDMDESAESDAMEVDDESDVEAAPGLSTGGFDWNGSGLDTADGADYESEAELAPKKKRKSDIKVDMTAELDKHGPQSTSDFERQLLGQPNDSALWIQYMAFHLELSEIQKARDIAERALRTIHIRETDEKANIWIALLNLEVEYGKEATLEEVFKRACQYQDKLTMHEKLASIYIDSGKNKQADDIFERIIKNKSFRASADVWYNYATFLLSQMQEPERARVLLPRAMKSVPTTEHRLLTAKFAALEFRTESGDPERGRTIFEGLVTEFPKWTTGWDMWVDIEQARVSAGDDKDSVARVSSLYERMSQAGMKKKRAKYVFKRWLEFEQAHGTVESQEKVKAVAADFVEKLKGQDDE